MGKENKIVTRVFSDIMAKENLPKYNEFLLVDKSLGIKEINDLKAAKNLYMNELVGIISSLKELSKLEELIIQIRSRSCLDTEIRLSIQREYIYARSTFFRLDKGTKDIRTIVGKTDKYGNNVKDLMENKNFMNLAKSALYDIMTEEINKNLKETLIPA